MIRYSYQLNDFRQWLRGFSALLHAPAAPGNLAIPRDMGDGAIRTAHLPEAISCMVMNFYLYEDLQLVSEAALTPGLCLFFNQIKTSDIYLARDNGHPVSERNHRGHLLLTSTGDKQEIILPRNSRLKGVYLYFPPSFLHRHVRKDVLADLFRLAATPSGYSEPISFESRQLLEDVYAADPSSPLYHLTLQNRAMLLAEKFLSSFLLRSSLPTANGKTWAKGREKDLEALKSIVRILSDNQLSKFPSIEALSKTAMMSSTKLKSRFKQIYGMKLYEFYNRHRLEQAKEMLKTGNYSVKQVGVNIGFSNLSNFAKAFKKEFGLLPKEVLKNK